MQSLYLFSFSRTWGILIFISSVTRRLLYLWCNVVQCRSLCSEQASSIIFMGDFALIFSSIPRPVLYPASLSILNTCRIPMGRTGERADPMCTCLYWRTFSSTPMNYISRENNWNVLLPLFIERGVGTRSILIAKPFIS